MVPEAVKSELKTSESVNPEAPPAPQTLRESLRQSTSPAHDLLDLLMRKTVGWSNKADYTRFLRLQHAARAPIEEWLENHAPSALRPPTQCDLIAEDLQDLGELLLEESAITIPSPSLPFQIAEMSCAISREAQALGAAWTLAGSALGNQTILKQINANARRKDETPWPSRFLGDRTMLTFWNTMRRQIERPACNDEVAYASQAAIKVFDHFIHIVRSHSDEGLNGLAQTNDMDSEYYGDTCPVPHQ